jgi:hypothetical protein
MGNIGAAWDLERDWARHALALAVGLLGASCSTPAASPSPAPNEGGTALLAVDTGVSVRDVALGQQICVLSTAGTVRCGSLSAPFTDVPLPAPAVSLSAGHVATCAILANGQTTCWDCPKPVPGVPTPGRAKPSVVALPLMKSIAVGWDAACGVTATGDMQCWGALQWTSSFTHWAGHEICAIPPNERVGAGTEVLRQRVAAAKIIVAPDARAFGPRPPRDATVSAPATLAWVLGVDGRLRRNRAEKIDLPPVADVELGGEGWVDSYGGVDPNAASEIEHVHACALLRDGRVSCWGDDRFDQAPPTMMVLRRPATAIAVGADHSCALLADRTVECWGANPGGALGSAPQGGCPARCQYAFCNAAPAPVEGLERVTRIRAAPGGPPFTCAVLESGRLVCWGSGYGAPERPSQEPKAPACDLPILG